MKPLFFILLPFCFISCKQNKQLPTSDERLTYYTQVYLQVKDIPDRIKDFNKQLIKAHTKTSNQTEVEHLQNALLEIVFTIDQRIKILEKFPSSKNAFQLKENALKYLSETKKFLQSDISLLISNMKHNTTNISIRNINAFQDFERKKGIIDNTASNLFISLQLYKGEYLLPDSTLEKYGLQ